MIRMETMHVRANAKVNLWLRVLGRRRDGYHEIETLFHGIDIADDVVVTMTDSESIVVEMSLADGMEGGVPAPEENLAYRAATRLASHVGSARGAHIAITKRIPIGAGLGGGSADAAAVLTVLNQLWQAGLDPTALRAVAVDVGSDVPYLLDGGTAIGTGRGEELRGVQSGGVFWFVLGISTARLSTADVYARWQAGRPTTRAGCSAIVEVVQSGDPARVAALLHNDLSGPAFALRPELKEAATAMVDAGALGSCVSGSGPTIFGVAHDRAHAEHVASTLAGHGSARSGTGTLFDEVRVARSAPRSIEIIERVQH
jgi:4-diphosphocytidyl-2-C-methyl-D-erythritol kinase